MCVRACVSLCVQVSAESVIERLSHIRFKPLANEPKPHRKAHRKAQVQPEPVGVRITAAWPNSTDLSTLRAMLLVLCALRFDSDHTARSATVVLRGWPMTHEALSALRELPHWQCTLSFVECTWPLESVEYEQLAQHVPSTYTRWQVDASAGFAKMYGICAGVNAHREGSGLGALQVSWSGYEGKGEGVGKHVFMVQ